MHYTTKHANMHLLYVIHSDSLPQARINSFHTRAYMNHIIDHLRKLLSNQPHQRTKRTFTIIPQENLFNILVVLLALRSNGEQEFSRISGVSPRSEEILTIINCAFGKIAKVNINIQWNTSINFFQDQMIHALIFLSYKRVRSEK